MLENKSVLVRVRQADVAAAKDAIEAAKKIRPAVTCVVHATTHTYESMLTGATLRCLEPN